MDPELKQKIENLETKIDAVYVSVEKTRRYFLIITWISILAIVLPMIGLVWAIPAFLSNYASTLGGLGM